MNEKAGLSVSGIPAEAKTFPCSAQTPRLPSKSNLLVLLGYSQEAPKISTLAFLMWLMPPPWLSRDGGPLALILVNTLCFYQSDHGAPWWMPQACDSLPASALGKGSGLLQPLKWQPPCLWETRPVGSLPSSGRTRLSHRLPHGAVLSTCLALSISSGVPTP